MEWMCVIGSTMADLACDVLSGIRTVCVCAFDDADRQAGLGGCNEPVRVMLLYPLALDIYDDRADDGSRSHGAAVLNCVGRLLCQRSIEDLFRSCQCAAADVSSAKVHAVMNPAVIAVEGTCKSVVILPVRPEMVSASLSQPLQLMASRALRTSFSNRCGMSRRVFIRCTSSCLSRLRSHCVRFAQSLSNRLGNTVPFYAIGKSSQALQKQVDQAAEREIVNGGRWASCGPTRLPASSCLKTTSASAWREPDAFIV
jgi:hypothetical protein